MLPKKLLDKLNVRAGQNSLRALGTSSHLIDFSSNDYLGFSQSEPIFSRAVAVLREQNLEQNGATGSRLLSGNHPLYDMAEKEIAAFHKVEEALIFNSGYDANIGFFGSVPQRGDIILYDELCHASIRDGITMSHAKAYKFTHNNLKDISKQLSVRAQSRTTNQEIYLVTESVFSMDGDQPDLSELLKLCKEHSCRLILDEAHALGVIGDQGEGLVQSLGLEKEVFARLITYGKAMGCHGAAILGSNELKSYLINFARSFIYTTGLPPHSVATILAAYQELRGEPENIKSLYSNIAIFKLYIVELRIQEHFIESESAIQSLVLPGNERVKKLATKLALEGFDVKPILSPTVAEGQERLRICLHSFNKETDIKKLLSLIANTIQGDFTK